VVTEVEMEAEQDRILDMDKALYAAEDFGGRRWPLDSQRVE